MNIHEAEQYLRERGKLQQVAEGALVVWARFTVENHEQLLARAQTEQARTVIEERYKECTAILMVARLTEGL